MKKLLVLLALCMVLSVVLVACDTPEQPEGESTQGTTTEAPTTQAPETTEPGTETEAPTTDTEAPTTDTEAPTTDTETETETETEKPADPVTTHISFDQFCTVLDGTPTDLFTPGQSASWDKKANIEDYHVQYIKIWGWAAFYGEAVGEFGYQINDEEPVFSADFAVEAEQAVIDAAAGKPASRFQIMVPVRDLSGEFTVKGLVKDAVGTVEEICVATVTKAVDPAAPVVLFNAETLGATATGAGSTNQVGSAVVSADGSYVTLTSASEGGDPWFIMRGVNANAQFIAVKYRTTVENKQYHYFVSSTGDNATGQGDMSDVHNYEADGKWHVDIIDISGVEKVDEAYLISFLRFDFYTNGTNESIDVAWIGGFNSAEYAEAYFAKSMIVADNTNTFTSDISGFEVGTAINSTDLQNFFTMNMPTGGSAVVDVNGEKAYEMAAINEMIADVNGAYYVYANVLSSTDPASIVVRGYQKVNADGLTQDTAAGVYNINNYYETDGNPGTCGGAGIYVNIKDGNLKILAKVYNAEKATRVDNAVLEIPCEGTNLTIADDGYTVYIIVDGVLYATIDLIGAQSYADINDIAPAGQFATKAVVKTATEEYVLENTLIAAAPSQVAVVARAGGIKFSAIEIGGFTQTIVPEFPAPEAEIETIFYDGTNGMVTIPAGGAVKFFFRGAAGMNLTIENSFSVIVTADNLMGATAVLQPNVLGTIFQEVPGDWFQFELLIENVSEEDAFIIVAMEEPAPEAQTLVVGENMVTAIVTKDGWNDAYFCTFTAEEAGDYTFTLTADYAAGSLFYFDAPVYGMCEENTVTLTLEAGQTVELGVSADVVMDDLVGATEDLVYTLGVNVTKA